MIRLLCLLGLVVALAGCGGGGSEEAKTQTAPVAVEPPPPQLTPEQLGYRCVYESTLAGDYDPARACIAEIYRYYGVSSPEAGLAVKGVSNATVCIGQYGTRGCAP